VEGYGAATYGDGMAEVYDDWYARSLDVDAAVDRIQALAGDGRVLELAIGTGRLALPLAARGVVIEGIDASAAMIARLRDKPGGAEIPVTVGDMADDLPPGPFRVVFVAYNSFFGLLSSDAQQRCFRAVAERLEPEGSFVLEAFVPQPPAPGSRVEVRHLTADRLVLMVSVDQPDDQRSEGHFVELTDGAPVRLRPWAVRWAFPDELDAMAARAGLEAAERWSGWAGEPFDGDSATHVSRYRRARRAGEGRT
jgi:SAM-dependent methyltransferase